MAAATGTSSSCRPANSSKANGDALDVSAQLGRQTGDRCRVDAPGEKHAYRHVGDQVRAHGIAYRLPHPFLQFLRCCLASFLLPVGADVIPAYRRLRHTGAHPQPVPSRQREHIAEQRPWLGYAAPEIEAHQSRRLPFRRNQPRGQQRLDLRGEDKPVLRPRVIERLDAIRIACQEQFPGLCVPDGKSEHAAQPRQHALALSGEQRQQDFRIGRGAEGNAINLQRPAQLAEVVNLAVEDDGVAPVGGHHRLVGAGVEVENGQAAMAQNDAFARPHPFRVRAAVVHAGGHTPDGIKR